LKVGELVHFFNEIYYQKVLSNFLVKKREFGIDKKFAMKKVSELSGGELQRFNLFISLFNNPKLFIGDEITSGLDIVNRIRIIKSIKREEKMTLLLVTHNWEEIHHLCRRIVFLKNGLIFCEKKVSDFKDYDSFSKYFSSVVLQQ
jgi:ABC-2 type transport system ATP-binding protein